MASGRLTSLKPVCSISYQSSHCWFKTNKKNGTHYNNTLAPTTALPSPIHSSFASPPPPLLVWLQVHLPEELRQTVKSFKGISNWEKSPLIQFGELKSHDFSTAWAHIWCLTLFPGFITHNTNVKLKNMERLSNIAMITWLSLMYDQILRQLMWCPHRFLLLQLILPLLELTQRITLAHPQALSQRRSHAQKAGDLSAT